MSTVGAILGIAATLFLIALFGRVLMSIILGFTPDWRPSGILLIATEAVFSITDPPLKALRKVIKPIQIGEVRIDPAMIVLFLLTYILIDQLGRL